MSIQKTANGPLTWLSLDKEGRASRHEGSFRTFFGTDIDGNGNTIKDACNNQVEARVPEWANVPRNVLLLDDDDGYEGSENQQEEVRFRNFPQGKKVNTMKKTSQDPGELHFDFPHNVLLLDRKEVPNMAHVLYGCHMEDAAAFAEEKGEEPSGDRREKRFDETGTRSTPQVSRMHTPHKVGGQLLVSPSTKMHEAGPSLRAHGHVSATFDAGTDDVEDDDITCRKPLQPGLPPGSERNWSCEACVVERSIYIWDRAQSRAASSLAGGRMGGRTEGGFQNPFLAPLPEGRQHRRVRRRQLGLPENPFG